MTDGPSATLVLVARNEPPARLDALLDQVRAQRGCGSLELVVAAPAEDHPVLGGLAPGGALATVRPIENPDGGRSAGLNRAIAAATAPVVVRVDARSRPPVDYVARCVARLRSSAGIGLVGGIQRPRVTAGTVRARAIARALRNPWMLGGARYRRPGAGGPADTAYLGAFRRAEIVAIGGYDEQLEANEDFDLCARMRAAGLDVWVEPGLEIEYEPRVTLRELWRQYRAFGSSKVRYWRHRGTGPNRRQALALAGAVVGAAVVALALANPVLGASAFAGGLVGALALDHVVEPRERDLRVRAAALVAYATIATGWCTGVAGAALSPPAGARRAHP